MHLAPVVVLLGARHQVAGRRVQLHFEMGKRSRHRLAQPGQHGVEECEGFLLVFVQRVLLRISAQADALAQVVQLEQVLLPDLVEKLEQDALLRLAHDVCAPVRGLFRHAPVQRRENAPADFLVRNAFLFRPVPGREIDGKHTAQLVLEALRIPLLRQRLFRDETMDGVLHDLVAHVHDLVMDIVDLHQVAALFIDDLALVVHHIVEFQQVLADFEVARLDLLLRLFQRLVDPGMDDGLAFLQAQPAQHPVHALGAENAHQIVFERDEELGGAGVALPPGASAELVVDPPALMALGRQHIEAAGLDHHLLVLLHLLLNGGCAVLALGADQHFHISAELDVGAAPRHVGGDGHGTRLARLRDNGRFLFVVARIQDLVGDLLALEPLAELFRLLDRDRADQHGLAPRHAVADLGQDGVVLLPRRAIDLVVVVGAHGRQVGGDFYGLQPVDLGELAGFGDRRAGHARELVVEAEIVLEGDLRERLVLKLDRNPLLGLQRLVQPLGVAPPFHRAPGEFVDDDDLAVADHVIDVALEQRVGAQRLVQMVQQGDIVDVVEAAFREQPVLAQQRLAVLLAGLVQGDAALFLVLLVMLGPDLRHQPVAARIELGRLLGSPRNDERRARLVDQDRVHLIDDGVGEAALDHFVEREFHVVAQIVEAEFVVGPVGDVGGVLPPPLAVRQAVRDAADGKAEELVDPAHPFGVALREIIVDRDDVDAPAGERVQIDRQRRRKRLALAGLHFGDHALVEDHPAHKLDVEMALSQGALGGLAHGGESLDEQVVRICAGLDAFAECVRAGPERTVRQRLQFRFERIDRRDLRPQAFQEAVVMGAEQALGDYAEHEAFPERSQAGPQASRPSAKI